LETTLRFSVSALLTLSGISLVPTGPASLADQDGRSRFGRSSSRDTVPAYVSIFAQRAAMVSWNQMHVI